MFRKMIMLIISSIMLTLFAFSCNNGTAGETDDKKNPIDKNPYYKTWKNYKEDMKTWITPGNILPGYVKLPDINPRKVQEIRPGFIIDNYGHLMEKIEGGILNVSMKALDETGESGESGESDKSDKSDESGLGLKVLIIRKMNIEGKVIWEKEYHYETRTGQVSQLLVLDDQSFIVALQTYPYYRDSTQVIEKSVLIKFDRDGNEIWKQAIDDYVGGLLKYVLINDKNDILAIGEWRIKDGRQTREGAPDNIVVTKFDQDGNVIKQKGFGGSDLDNVNTVKYEKDLGIVLNGSTRSRDGDFAIEGDDSAFDFIACIDDDLDVRWVVHAEEKESFAYNQLAVGQDMIYVIGHHHETDAPVEGYILKLDRAGRKVLKSAVLFKEIWGQVISRADNGDIFIGAGLQNKGMIVILDKDGNEKARLDDLKMSPDNIIPTQDNGFIVTSTRQKKYVPQPPVISSIWYDTELVVAKYDYEYKIEWRKTFDRYINQLGPDFAWPFEDGSIVVY